MNNELSEIRFKRGEYIFNQGDISETFYVVKTGRVQLSTNVDIEDSNRYPIVNHNLSELNLGK